MSNEPINLHRLAQMDPDVVAEVHDRYFAELFRYARYRVSRSDAAEDIVSDVFVRLLEAVKRGKGPHSNLRGWLLSTCSNTINDYFRKAYQRESEKLADSLAAAGPGPATALAGQEDQAELQTALARLTAEQQHVIALRFGAGCSLQETATLMGKRVNAVKALQFRAIGALRREMGVDRP
jgi:RNA polymerase sigma-70 factor (ECF subfamily)